MPRRKNSKKVSKLKDKYQRECENLKKKVDGQLVLKMQHKQKLAKIQLNRTVAAQKGQMKRDLERRMYMLA